MAFKFQRLKKIAAYVTGTLVVLLVVAIVAYSVLTDKYRRRAAEFDLKQLERMESASVIFDRHGEIFGHIYIQNRDFVPLSKMSLPMLQAIVAAEDARFYSHDGVDYYGIARAFIANLRGRGIKQGASTITQQLARNTFALTERTYERKLVEVYLAQRIEQDYEKKKILELYLNRIYFGSGFFGVEAASKAYFGKPASELNLIEAATLAGLIKSPTKLSPWNNPDLSQESRDMVLNRMQELGFIKREELKTALETPLTARPRVPVHIENYAIDAIRQQVIAIVGSEESTSDGYRIYTTFDRGLQQEAEKFLVAQMNEIEQRSGYPHETYAQYTPLFKQYELERDKGLAAERLRPPAYLQGALFAVENKSGEVLSMVGGRNFKQSEYNRTTMSRRPTGTAFLPFVFAAGLENGLHPAEMVDDAVIDNRLVMIGGETGILGEWGVERADNRYEGLIPARSALVESKNAASVRFGNKVGLTAVKELAAKAGIRSPLRDYPSTYLGSSENTLAEVVNAYTIFPNGGWNAEQPFILRRIESKKGAPVYATESKRQRAISATTAFQVHHMLRDALSRGTGKVARTRFGLGEFEVAGKTGTAYNFTDLWFVGYSSAVTCGVWAGFDRPASIYRGAFSSDLVLPVWVNWMNAAVKKYPAAEFQVPEGLKQIEVCAKSGEIATEDCFERVRNADSGQTVTRRTTYLEYFTPEQTPKLNCTVHSNAFRSYVRELPDSEDGVPRAVAAVDLSVIKPVQVRSSTIVGKIDPYQTVRPSGAIAAEQTSINPGDLTAVGEDGAPVEVRRAEAARPLDLKTEEGVILVRPPPPIKF